MNETPLRDTPGPFHPIGFDYVPEPGIEDDPSGRDRLAWNVITSWAGHTVFIVAGFVMPRLIDRTIGQAALGIWDFAWLLMGYFSNMQLGIGVSVNRHVARQHAQADTEGLRATVSSVTAIDVVMGLAILAASWIVALALPSIFGSQLGEHTQAARWVVALLGTTLAVQTATDAFRGVISGLHRWDVHNAINSGFYAVTIAAMILVLDAGHGLRGLAATYAAGHLIAEIARVLLAYRLCPELRVRWRYVDRTTARRMFVFGGKAFLDGISRLLLIQGNSLVVTSFLGPAALAVFARPNSLVRHAEAFMAKFSHVLTPAASSLQGSGRSRELQELLIEGGRLATGLTLAMLGFMAVMAGPILEVWMGSRYENEALLAVLAIGSFVPLTQHPTMTILVGLNLHGRVAAISSALAVVGVAFSILAVGHWGLGLIGAAVAIAAPMSLMATAVALYACRRLKIDLAWYVRRVYIGPMLCAAPWLLLLLALRLFLDLEPLTDLLLGAMATVVLLVPLYWLQLLSSEHRRALRAVIRRSMESLRIV